LRREYAPTNDNAMVKAAGSRGLFVGLRKSGIANQEIECGARGLPAFVTYAVTRRCEESPAVTSKEVIAGSLEVVLSRRPVQVNKEIPLVRAESSKLIERARFGNGARNGRRRLRACFWAVSAIVPAPAALAAASNRPTSLYVVSRFPAVRARHVASI
jgi:hypothetical protein